MSEDQENAVLGRTLKEYSAARRRLAALHAEIEHLGEYLAIAGHALKTSHSLWAQDVGDSGTGVDLKGWPAADYIKQLIEDGFATQHEKDRLAAILEGVGLKQPE